MVLVFTTTVLAEDSIHISLLSTSISHFYIIDLFIFNIYAGNFVLINIDLP